MSNAPSVIRKRIERIQGLVIPTSITQNVLKPQRLNATERELARAALKQFLALAATLSKAERQKIKHGNKLVAAMWKEFTEHPSYREFSAEVFSGDYKFNGSTASGSLADVTATLRLYRSQKARLGAFFTEELGPLFSLSSVGDELVEVHATLKTEEDARQLNTAEKIKAARLKASSNTRATRVQAAPYSASTDSLANPTGSLIGSSIAIAVSLAISM